MKRVATLLFLLITSSAFAQDGIVMQPPTPPNTYVPLFGNPIDTFQMTVGGADPWDIPGIGPTPPAGLMSLAADYEDSTGGNISNLYAVARNRGTRYTTALTGVGVNESPVGGGSTWGLAGIGIAATPGSFAVGAQLEAESGAPGTNSIAALLSTGCYAPSCADPHPTTGYLGMVSNQSGASPWDMMFINDTATNPVQPTGSVLTNYGDKLHARNGIYFTAGAQFDNCVFGYGSKFCVRSDGVMRFGNFIPGGCQITGSIEIITTDGAVRRLPVC